MSERKLRISDSAAQRIAVLKEREGNPDLMLRITVLGGGCSGFQYKFDFDDKINGDDFTFEKDSITVITDDTSLDLLDNSEIDYTQDIMAAAFTINNPNAKTSCGCGNSFSVDME